MITKPSLDWIWGHQTDSGHFPSVYPSSLGFTQQPHQPRDVDKVTPSRKHSKRLSWFWPNLATNKIVFFSTWIFFFFFNDDDFFRLSEQSQFVATLKTAAMTSARFAASSKLPENLKSIELAQSCRLVMTFILGQFQLCHIRRPNHFQAGISMLISNTSVNLLWLESRL